MKQIGNAQLHTGDVLEVLSSLPSESVHCCVTSPPYWGLRDYNIDGQLGLERTPQEHICNMVAVFREVRRVLRKDGVCWMNYGDCYAGSPNGRSAADVKALGNDDRTFRDKPFSSISGGLKPKDLCMMPARIALALQEDGWWIRSEIVWCKRSPMPESVTDRPTSATEKIYLLTKSDRYFYDADAIREPHARDWRGEKWAQKVNYGTKESSMGVEHGGDKTFAEMYNPNGRNCWNYWLISSEPFPDAHFATFPPEIPKRCILAGTSERGVCAACGAQWRRVVETKQKGQSWGDHSRDSVEGAHQDGKDFKGQNFYKNFQRAETIDWQPSCKCNAPTVPATVLDPFSGAGTTAMVALQLGRQAIGIELNPEYQQIAARRLQKHASQEVMTF